jgi:hypothetical protein
MNYQAPMSHMRPTSSSHLKKVQRKNKFKTGTDETGEYFSISSENFNPGHLSSHLFPDKSKLAETSKQVM